MVLRNFYIEPKDEEITVTFLCITNEPVREAKPSQPRREVDKRKYIFLRVFLFAKHGFRACSLNMLCRQWRLKEKLDPTKIITIFSIPSTYLLILPNRQLLVDTRKVYENCSRATVKTPERRLLLCLLWTDFTHYFCIFIVALNKLMLVGYLLVSWHLFLHKSLTSLTLDNFTKFCRETIDL